MTFITKLILHFCLFTVIKVLTEHDNAEYERFKTFETIFDFIVELRNASDDIVDYAKTIQALFCPEQPLCTNNGIRNRTDVMDTLPKTIVIGTEAYRIEEVHKIVGACCLPCSCDRRNCQEDGNCCLSKVVEDALRDYSDMDDRNTQGIFILDIRQSKTLFQSTNDIKTLIDTEFSIALPKA